MVVPADRYVRFYTAAADVIHSWAVPAFAVKVDAIPGRLNEGWISVKEEGLYFGQCSQICGQNHSFMPIGVRVVSQADFDKWVADKKKAAGDPSQPALFEAMDEVLDAQAGKLAITRRIAGDIKDIWALQPRFDKRTGKTPYRVIEQPRYRAGWDFLRLRAQAGEIPMEIVDWWDDFAHAGHDERETLIRQAPAEATPVAKKRRRKRRKPAGASEDASAEFADAAPASDNA